MEWDATKKMQSFSIQLFNRSITSEASWADPDGKRRKVYLSLLEKIRKNSKERQVEEVCIHIFIVRVKSTICTTLPITLLTFTSSSSKIFCETDRGESCIHLCWLLLLYNMTWLGRNKEYVYFTYIHKCTVYLTTSLLCYFSTVLILSSQLKTSFSCF